MLAVALPDVSVFTWTRVLMADTGSFPFKRESMERVSYSYSCIEYIN